MPRFTRKCITSLPVSSISILIVALCIGNNNGVFTPDVICTTQGTQSNPITIPWNWTASDQDPEHRLNYWREDYGLNYFHWHWHLSYPFAGDFFAVNKSRRGELFYYVHQQIMARYNFERLSNNMRLTVPLDNWDQPIREAYFPKLDSIVASRTWAGRPSNLVLRDINRAEANVSIANMRVLRERILWAIQFGYAVGQGNSMIQLNELNGIDTLGNIIESSIISVNRDYYGDLHNDGHRALGYIHDPFFEQLEPVGVMGNNATAIRDPIFYPWHAFVNNLFQAYHDTLPGYTVDQLDFPGVQLGNVNVCTNGDCQGRIQTYWDRIQVNLTRGLDFQQVNPRVFRLTLLQHLPFNYQIEVHSDASREVTCRIFMAPKFDDLHRPWHLSDQRNFFIELDRFRVFLTPGGNMIQRSSIDSSVTIPFERTYRDLDTFRPLGGDALDEFIFCGCGWPANLLIPRGNQAGFPAELFVMITDAYYDRVEEDSQDQCNDVYSYCGIRNREYPDRHHMGFPFDRPPRWGVRNLAEFLTPNMRVADVTIQLVDTETY